MTKFPRVFWILGLILLTPLWGCHHQIAFEDIDYKIDSPKQDRSILLIIEPQTLNQVRSINSWMTGAAHSWDAYPGQMLKQVADVEFPQMFHLIRIAPPNLKDQWPHERLSYIWISPTMTFQTFTP